MQESVWIILADIVLEAFGVTADRRVFQQFLEQEENAREVFQRLIAEISNQPRDGMADPMDELLRWLVVGEGVGN